MTAKRSTLRLLTVCRIVAACYFLFTLYALFSPNPHLEKIGITTFSLIHTAAFFVLGFLFELARRRFPRRILYLLLILYGPLTEFLQPLTGRFFEWTDILEDIIGVSLGLWAACGIKAYAAKRGRGKAVRCSPPRE
ncbi:MAG: VanZ family protein [Thermoguttaceae bacterium]